MPEEISIDIIPISEIDTEIFKNCIIEIYIIRDVEMAYLLS